MASAEFIQRSRLLRELKESLLPNMKRASNEKKDAEAGYKDTASAVLPVIVEVNGINGTGVRFEYEGQEYAAYVCQPEPAKLWDAAPLIEYLKENGHWQKVSQRVLDPMMLEAQMAAGNIKREDLEKFQVSQEPGKPYVKWINPKPESL